MEKRIFTVVGRKSQLVRNYLFYILWKVIIVVEYILFAVKLENLFNFFFIFRTGIPVGKVYRRMLPAFFFCLIQFHLNFIISHIIFHTPCKYSF